MKKKILISLILVVLASPALSQSYTYSPNESSVYTPLNFEAKCTTSSGGCVSGNEKLEICGNQKSLQTSTARLLVQTQKTYKFSSKTSLKQLGCSAGASHTAKLVGDSGSKVLGDIKATKKISGQYLRIVAEVENNFYPEPYRFELQDSFDSSKFPSAPTGTDAGLLLSEVDPKKLLNRRQHASYVVASGVRVSRDEVLSDMGGTCQGPNCAEGDKVLKIQFVEGGPTQCSGSGCSANYWPPSLQSDYSFTLSNNYPYMPTGELMSGYSVNTVESSPLLGGSHTERIYQCIINDDEADGTTIYDGTGFAYRCDAFGDDRSESWRKGDPKGKWQRVYACSDGKDNDDDGRTDLNDPDCNGNWKGKSEGSVPCPTFIGLHSGVKTAYYNPGNGTFTDVDRNPFGNGCDYKNEVSPNGLATSSPQKFVCENDGSVASGAGGVKSSFCSSLTTFHGNNVSAVMYNVPSSSIPLSPSVKEQLKADGKAYSNTSVDSGKAEEIEVEYPGGNETFIIHKKSKDFVRNTQSYPGSFSVSGRRKECVRNKGGFINRRCESLHMAELEYGSPAEVHNEPYWTKKGMNQTGGYSKINLDNVSDAWVTANAGATDANISEPGTLIGEDSQVRSDAETISTFTGGFAGRCGPNEGKWVYRPQRGDWGCSKTLGIMTVQTFNMDLSVSDVGGNFTGIRVPASSFKTWKQVYPNSPPLSDQPLEAEAQCWEGTYTERPTDTTKMVHMFNLVDSTNDPAYLVKRLPDRDDSKTEESRYSCIYGFKQYVPFSESSQLLQSTELWENKSLQTIPASGYILEGSDLEGQVRIQNQSIDLSVRLPEVQYDSRRPNPGFIDTGPKEQNYLSNVAGNTSATSAPSIFQDYPEGGSTLNPLPTKDPLQDFFRIIS